MHRVQTRIRFVQIMCEFFNKNLRHSFVYSSSKSNIPTSWVRHRFSRFSERERERERETLALTRIPVAAQDFQGRNSILLWTLGEWKHQVWLINVYTLLKWVGFARKTGCRYMSVDDWLPPFVMWSTARLDRLQLASQYQIWTTAESVGLKANILF